MKTYTYRIYKVTNGNNNWWFQAKQKNWLGLWVYVKGSGGLIARWGSMESMEKDLIFESRCRRARDIPHRIEFVEEKEF